MKVLEVVNEIIENNEWLNGWCDYLDGDLMALSKPDEYFNTVIEVDDIEVLFKELKNFVGVYKYKNLLFFKDSQHGTFVYDINDTKNYVEHLSIDDMRFEEFCEIVNKLVR